ncbi:MAG: flagellar basal body rod protein FlgB [Candidatus Omnitrophica bacterium]|nr:flagellar basal body rod protein FlgB [Candidatus Omnitrophota bacterium]
MITGRLFSETTLDVLKKGIEGTLARNQAIANNIANVDTPSYQRAEVSFEDQLRKVLRGEGITGRRTDSAHFIIGGAPEIAAIRPFVEIDRETRFRPDRNNVNIDQEMAALAENTQKNLEFTELLSRRYDSLRNVIRTAGQA